MNKTKKQREWTKNWQRTHKEQVRATCKAYYQAHREQILANVNSAASSYYQANKARILAYCKAYKKANKKRHSAHNRKWNKKHIRTIKERLHRAISVGICRALKRKKGGTKWTLLVGYTIAELKSHLEKQFTNGMSWDNYGKWHIDHIIPKKVFNYDSPDHIDFKRCWALSNLQPMWASENIRKSTRLTKSFQPCLKLEF